MVTSELDKPNVSEECLNYFKGIQQTGVFMYFN